MPLEIPSSSQRSGHRGYPRWRRALYNLHLERAGGILSAVGYDWATIGMVQHLVAKRGLGDDTDVQTLEDALRLVFIETGCCAGTGPGDPPRRMR